MSESGVDHRVWESYVREPDRVTGEMLFVHREAAEQNLVSAADSYGCEFDPDDLEQTGEHCWRYDLDDYATAVLVHAAVYKEVPQDV